MGARMDRLEQAQAPVAWSKVATGDCVMIPSKRAVRNGKIVFVGSGEETRIANESEVASGRRKAGEVIHALDGQVKPAKAVVIGKAQNGWTGVEGENLPQGVRTPAAKALAAAAKPKARKAAAAKAQAPDVATLLEALLAALKAQA